ncbi:UDP-N-acetylmuramate--L-alanine ligase [Parasporobacterium paucivorans]|uniref:UDP-N-acetylmuramate--L-alanine ligase n=1 Tax=Parasporobacterium paucivorans DSM 15970 TaxID=1122934 RepID=A0A1M6CSG9_9FIRM|nr:UDP-N-acetylmuramate--L-alanine ligase [Parasporobacterium paucivorans]SHI63967.1 UDP-N-acetylmuramate--L-alanine ligase [Parasporobacterium paucivorans DSM 15970]
MYKIDFSNKIHVYFIGIGGISMSALAEILLTKGFTVSGSDSRESDLTKRLERLGITVHIGQSAENLDNDIDLVIYTAAIKEDNPELAGAHSFGIPSIPRAELVGQIMKNYEVAVGVAGTHGKTTTTSMISHILIDNDSDPTVLVGGMLKKIEGNLRIGKSGNFVTEACEYTNSFLSFSPTVAVILNIHADHMDFFKDIQDIRQSFRNFASLLPLDGTLIISSDIEDFDYITQGTDARIVTFGTGLHNSDYGAANVAYDEFANGHYDLMENGSFAGRISLKVPGFHNIQDSLAAVATARTMGVPIDLIIQSLAAYEGCDRRFQFKGSIKGITVVDDYAHHPDEIRATLNTARKYPHKTLWCVFQPHTYTRTSVFLKDFASALTLADKVVLTDIYAAREKNTLNISSKDLLDELVKLGKEAYHFQSFDDIENFLLENCINGDLLITMGAGDVVLIGERLLGQ